MSLNPSSVIADDLSPVTKKPDGTDNRGTSMVQKHIEKLQQEKEASAKDRLQHLMPHFGNLVRERALKETQWNVEKAALLLRRFQICNATKLEKLHEKRKKILDTLRKKNKSTSFTDSSSESSSQYSPTRSSLTSNSNQKSSEEEDDASKSESTKKKHHKKKKHKRKRTKEDEKNVSKKKHKKKHMSKSKGEFGKFGIIRESDMNLKRPEFCIWAAEVHKTDVESLSRAEEKSLFKDFMEDYNTGTLSHRKYYDYALYQKKKRDKKKKKKEKGMEDDEEWDFNDEEKIRKEAAMQRERDQKNRVKRAYDELKNSQKASDMREQQMLRMQMSLAFKTGDLKTVKKLSDRLKPDDIKDNSNRNSPIDL